MTLPNIPCQTLGGKYFWETLANSNGWKLQKNRFTNHYRILDPANIRQAWNIDEEEIWHVFRAMTNQQEHQKVIEHL
ncbi:hypothetical protein [Lysinibacillus endophyticus]|uniref:hypothetical protein n=1 Tax=Ureibacillus endophyticus TaxID=1978490 RepID=UPI00209CCBE3|nr:hypothetical protein [Lysinibacillus endophyticus]MCP1143656.1 hypothetical protein [Lysinibacillus endophyticus]